MFTLLLITITMDNRLLTRGLDPCLKRHAAVETVLVKWGVGASFQCPLGFCIPQFEKECEDYALIPGYALQS
jgi:hypothetical protein